MEPRLREAHYPGRAAIEAYGNGGFRFAGMSHRGAILCLPSGIYAWQATEPREFDRESFAPVTREAAGIEILLVGTGDCLVPLPVALQLALREKGISADAMSTGAAVVLLAERRAVAAALLPVE